MESASSESNEITKEASVEVDVFDNRMKNIENVVTDSTTAFKDGSSAEIIKEKTVEEKSIKFDCASQSAKRETDALNVMSENIYDRKAI